MHHNNYRHHCVKHFKTINVLIKSHCNTETLELFGFFLLSLDKRLYLFVFIHLIIGLKTFKKYTHELRLLTSLLSAEIHYQHTCVCAHRNVDLIISN